MVQEKEKVDQYELLAEKIILKAVKDYRRALKRLQKHTNDSWWLYQKKDIEEFFRSEYFSALTPADPEKIITRIQLEEDYI